MCIGCSKEPSHQDSSFQYPQHMCCLRIKKIEFSSIHTVMGGGGGVTVPEIQCVNEFRPRSGIINI